MTYRTFDEFWGGLCDTNEPLRDSDGVMRIKTQALKRLLERAFEAGSDSITNGNKNFASILGKAFNK